eukprot:jgi/Mesen1/2969/ME000176S02008
MASALTGALTVTHAFLSGALLKSAVELKGVSSARSNGSSAGPLRVQCSIENRPQGEPTSSLGAATVAMDSLYLATSRSVVVKAAENVVEAAGEADPISTLSLQSDADKKASKKLVQRRKRLLRKRQLRKKGRWPPSKMAAHANV